MAFSDCGSRAGAGWTADSWDEGDWLDEESGDYGGCGSWDELTEAARADAAQLGYDSLEWDLCHFEPEDAGDAGEVGEAKANSDADGTEQAWRALHAVVAGEGLRSLAVPRRRTVELAVELALEEMLQVAAEMAEEEAEWSAAASSLDADAWDAEEQLEEPRMEAKARWWGQLEPACRLLVSGAAQVHGGRGEGTAAALGVLAQAQEATGQLQAALELYTRLGSEAWDGERAESVRRGARFEMGRLLATRGDAGVDEAARLFTQEFEALWASTMAPGAQAAEEGDSEMLQLFGHALEAVLRAQHKTPEANAIEARVAEAAAAGGR